MHGEHRADEPAEIRGNVVDDRLLQGREERLYAARCVDHHPTGRHQHARHLGGDRDPVLHEHQAHLAQDDVDGCIWDRQRRRIRDAPLDPGTVRCGDILRDVDHVGRDVDAGHRAVGTDSLGGQATDQTGATCDIEHAFTRLQVGHPKQFVRHRGGDGRHEVALIVLGGGAGEMLV
jgi:hypothetical protein